MMLIDNTFELEIPTHIAFTLYKHDYIDNLIISRVKKECKNESDNASEFIVSLDQFEKAMHTSAFLRAQIQKTIDMFNPVQIRSDMIMIKNQGITN